MFNLMRKATGAPAMEDVIRMVGTGEMVLVDIRDAGELAMTGKADGALHIPMMRLPMVADSRHPDFDPRLDPSKAIGLYCASGARSAMAVQLLKRLGYENVQNVGGFGQWVRAGGACCTV